MEILELELDKLKPYDKNAKTHPEEQVQLIANSIKEFGFRTPILVDDDFVIIQGHGRRLASQSLGLNTVPCVIADNLSKEQVKMLRLADNKVAESEWDVPLLDMELLELNDFFEIEDFGFELEVEVVGETDADAVPEVEENPVIKLGDLVEMGNHRLFCGDSTNEEDMSIMMGEQKASLVFTDPPWNVNYGAVKEGNAQGYKPRTIMNDFMGTDDFKTFMDNTFKNMAKFSIKGCMTYVVMSAQEWGNMMLTLASNDYHWSSTIIWNKSSLVLSRKDYHTKYEPIWYGWLGDGRVCPLKDRKQSDVWDFDRPKVSELHPTTKPVDLVEQAIFNSSKTKDVVLDLFGGSGTTLIACENLSRNCRMMELDPKYAQVIIQRYCDYTGNDTITINGEEVSWSEYKERAEHSREKVS